MSHLYGHSTHSGGAVPDVELVSVGEIDAERVQLGGSAQRRGGGVATSSGSLSKETSIAAIIAVRGSGLAWS